MRGGLKYGPSYAHASDQFTIIFKRCIFQLVIHELFMSWEPSNRSSLELVLWGTFLCGVPIFMLYGLAIMPGMTFLRFIIGSFVLLCLGGVMFWMGLQCWRELFRR